jgi:hypothetical protein
MPEVRTMINTIEVSVVPGPDGRPSVLLQVDDEWHIGMTRPEEVRALAGLILDAARELEERLG